MSNIKQGSNRGQTTVAAKLNRWQGMSSNLTPHLDELPHLKDPLSQLQTVLAQAQALRDRQMVTKADSGDATKQLDQLFATGDELYARLKRGLQSAHGAQSSRLKEFGVKPLGAGRPRKQPPEVTPVELEPAKPPAATAAPTAGAASAPAK